MSSIDRRTAEAEADRGRLARQPRQVPYKGWWDVVWRVKDQIAADNVSIIAGGLALFGLLAVFPSLAAAVAIYGLIGSPEAIAAQAQAYNELLPQGTLEIIQGQLNDLARQQSNTLGAGIFLGFLLAIWSARRGMVALMTAMNVAYNEQERRGFFHRLALSLLFTLCGVVGFVLVVLLGLAVPVLIGLLPLGGAGEWVLLSTRWALLWAIAALALSALYRFAPNRSRARWHWVSWGSGIAATLWLIGSICFALYVRNFDTFGRTYGAIGGVVVMLMWFYVSAFVIILGAEINSELERQTVRDTTNGEPKPLGERGAFSADTVGPRAGR